MGGVESTVVVASFLRKVPTASAARAVQIANKRGRQVVGIEHIGSAHDDAELAVLMEIGRQQLHAGQGVLDLGMHTPGGSVSGAAGPRVVGRRSQLLWEVLGEAYDRLGFGVVGDEAFQALVLRRVVEPTSKADTLRVLAELGVPAPSLRTVFRMLARCVERDYRGRLATACLAHSAGTPAGRVSLVLYDCTTLYFETDTEDSLRRVGMSKERRLDPQIQVGLLVDAAGFPLEVHCFEGNTAETTTLIPVLRAFQARHGVADRWPSSSGPRCCRRATSTLSRTPGSASSSARGSARPPTTWPSTSPGTPHPPDRLPVLLHPAQARRPGDQRDGRVGREGRPRAPGR